MADRAAVRTAKNILCWISINFPLKYSSSECPMIIKVFVFSTVGKSEKSKSIVLDKSIFLSRSRLWAVVVDAKIKTVLRTLYYKFYGSTVQAILNVTCWKLSQIRTNKFKVLQTKTKSVWTNSLKNSQNLIHENEFVIPNSWQRNHKFCSHPRTVSGQTTAIRALLSKQSVWHVISLERGDFKLSIGSLNNKFH